MRLLHPFDRFRPWFRELARYHRHLSWPGFWARYEISRMWAKNNEPGIWQQDDRTLRDYYRQCDYLLYRQAYYHRDRSFRWLKRLVAPPGRICEYGCGVAPASVWMADHTRRGDYEYTLVDVPNPAFTYAQWRMKERQAVCQARAPSTLVTTYDAIVCLEVLEHVPNPDLVMRHLIAHLAPGGYLAVNFVEGEPMGLNLASAQRQRKATVDLLKLLDERQPMDRDGGGLGLYRAPMDNDAYAAMQASSGVIKPIGGDISTTATHAAISCGGPAISVRLTDEGTVSVDPV